MNFSKEQLEQLTRAYNEYKAEEESDADSETTAPLFEFNLEQEIRRLRSGSSHLRRSPSPTPSKPDISSLTNTMSPPGGGSGGAGGGSGGVGGGSGGSTPGLPPQIAQLFANPIKVLQTNATVPEYTGEGMGEYQAREFIRLCEDVMKNSYITEPVEKISFIRSNIKQGSLAARMMQTSSFTAPLKRQNYDLFRSTFLETFGDDLEHSLVKGVAAAAETMISGANAQSLLEAQIDASRLSEDLLKYLRKSNWMGDTMTEENLGKFLEFLFYMQLLNGKLRKGSLSLKYEPTERLHDFVSKLKIKMQEKEGETNLVGISKTASVTASQVTSGVAALSLKPPSKHWKPTGTNRSASWAEGPQMSVKDNRRPQEEFRGKSFSKKGAIPKQKTTNRPAPRAEVYCTYHKSPGHSTHDCFTVNKIMKEVHAQRGHRGAGQRSGEATRPHKPDRG